MNKVPIVALTLYLLLVSQRLIAVFFVNDHHVTSVFAVELCEELTANGYSSKAQSLARRLENRAEQFTADLTPEQWNEVSKRKFQ